jgi:hypothetical protein
MGTAAAEIGTVDTVGGTIYDWQYGWAAYRYIANAPGHGIHVTWMWSNDTIGSQADRNMRCNYYDYATHDWQWLDPDYMMSGCDVFTERAGFGNIDADPVTGVAVVSCHAYHAGGIRPIVARDIAPGAGIFEYCDGSPVLDNYLWPLIGVSRNQTVHMHCLDDPARTDVWYSRAVTWCNWDPPMQVTPIAPTFPAHNITASKVSNKVCLMWIKADAVPLQAFYRVSSDGGTNWDSIVDLGYPPAFGPDTGCSYYITSSMPFYDRHDRLHIAVDVMPIINDTVWAAPVELWHWCGTNNPVWSRVHRADADPHGSQSAGTNALFACRPSIGEDRNGNLFASWEQFDTLNVEPLTDLMRGDIWLAGSADNGQSWCPGMMITTQSTVSHRFPCMIDLAIDGGQDPDTVVVLYEDDSVAGFRAGSAPAGPWSHNPYIAHKVPADLILSGMAEPREGTVTSLTGPERLSVAGSLARGSVRIHYSLPSADDVRLQVFDAAGRRVTELAAGRRAAGRHTVDWNATAASPGVYYCTLRNERSLLTEKVILAR